MSDNLSSQRQLRFSELIRSLISECLLVEDFYNFSFETTSITISYVKMSKDLRIENVYLMPLGGENKNKIIEEIDSQKFIFQKFLSQARLNSKFTPKINFYLDDSLNYIEAIEKELKSGDNPIRMEEKNKK